MSNKDSEDESVTQESVELQLGRGASAEGAPRTRNRPVPGAAGQETGPPSVTNRPGPGKRRRAARGRDAAGQQRADRLGVPLTAPALAVTACWAARMVSAGVASRVRG